MLRCEYLKLDDRNPTKVMSDAGKPLAVQVGQGKTRESQPWTSTNCCHTTSSAGNFMTVQ